MLNKVQTVGGNYCTFKQFVFSFESAIQFEMEESSKVCGSLKEVIIREGFKGSEPYFKYCEIIRQQEGYMGDLLFITIQDKHTDETLDLMVKSANTEETARRNFSIDLMYCNEAIFYKIIWTNYLKFQEIAHCPGFFDKISKFYVADLEEGKEKLFFENLKSKNFKTINKHVVFNKEHFELIFTEYGKFHGLSMAFKSKFPYSFREMAKDLINYWSGLENMKMWQTCLSIRLQDCGIYLSQEPNKDMIQQFEKYIDYGWRGFSKSTEYDGKNAVITHGECWPSNFMFKYNENKKPVDIRFIDFHRSRVGTPVFDLSYCFYAGGSSEIFEELDYYLDIYHKSLSNTLMKMNCDPEKLYSKETLKKEWKMYCKFGFVMGLLGLRDHTVREEYPMDISELLTQVEHMRISDTNERYSAEEVEAKSVELIKHMYVNGFL
nr:uncharacterized protein LOC111509390 [Leptinotarsa decemlineata]